MFVYSTDLLTSHDDTYNIVAEHQGFMVPMHLSSSDILVEKETSDPTIYAQHPKGSAVVCHICNKHFANKSNLNMHYRVHTGERPFRCKYCSYKASKAFNLRSHVMRKHLNEDIVDFL